MKAITLTQPWATLVAIGAKRFETRSWQPRHLGPIAIHAARGVPAWVGEAVAANPAIRSHLGEHGLTLDSLPHGVVVATADLMWAEPTDSVIISSVVARFGSRDEWDLGDYGPGRWAWYLAGVRPLPQPVPARGALHLWEWTPPDGLPVGREVTKR